MHVFIKIFLVKQGEPVLKFILKKRNPQLIKD